MKLLKIGLSGVRGVVGEALTPEPAMDFACAFGTAVGPGRILIARDTRSSGPMLRAASVSALVSTGCDVVDLGVCPTPILQFWIPRLKARGGLAITAGHNDTSWNALTFINRDGAYLNEYQGQEVLDLFHLGRFSRVASDRLGTVRTHEDPLSPYFHALMQVLDRKTVGNAGFKVVADPCNGAAAGIVDRFFSELGCEFVPVNNTPSGYFPHPPEPRPRNASETSSIVRIAAADAGFLLNSDGSRVSLVAEDGETLSEEYTFPIAAGRILERDRGPVVTTLSTSRMIEGVAARRKVPVVMSKVGQSPVIQTMIAEDAAVAGEGSGGVAARLFQPAFDGFLTMGLILEAMAVRKMKLSELAAELPRFHIVKEKIYCLPHRIHSVVARTRDLFPEEDIQSGDGIRVERRDGWIQIRASATEPMIRITAEFATRRRALEELDRVAAEVVRMV
jgi:phosphomannomutase